MSVIIETIITCDGDSPHCHGNDWSSDSRHLTAKEQRKMARNHMGWHHVKDGDFCQQCWVPACRSPVPNDSPGEMDMSEDLNDWTDSMSDFQRHGASHEVIAKYTKIQRDREAAETMNPTTSPLTDALRERQYPKWRNEDTSTGREMVLLDQNAEALNHAAAMESLAGQLKEALESSEELVSRCRTLATRRGLEGSPDSMMRSNMTVLSRACEVQGQRSKAALERAKEAGL